MGFSHASFIRKTSPELLRSYFTRNGVDLPDEARWDGKPLEIRNGLIAAFDQIPRDTRRRIVRDWERIGQLSNELGHDAVMRAFRDRRGEVIEEFKTLAGAHDRALWLFLNRPHDFDRAEQIAFARFYRGRQRFWDGFVGPRGASVRRDASRLHAFRGAITALYGTLDGSGEQVNVEVYDHEGSDVVQTMMYIAALREIALEFENDRLTPRERQLATEAAVLYCPTSGAIDVVAPGGSPTRTELAALFVEHLLESDQPVERLALRQYQLNSLRRPRPFPVDREDRIFGVEVRRLRLEPRDGKGGRYGVEKTPGQVLSIYERSSQVLGWDRAVPDELDVTATRMAVVFMASRGTGPGRTLTFDLALTNGSTLKDHTRRERLIDEKYLERWGLVAVVKRAAATPAAELVR